MKRVQKYPTLRSKIGEKIQRIRFALKYRERHSLNIMDWKQSIDAIILERKSLARFGDGELLMVYQYLGKGLSNSTFQNYSSSLGKRLYEILVNTPPQNIFIGLPKCMFDRGLSDMTFNAKYFWERFSADWVSTTINILNPKISQYADTNLTRFYNDYKNKNFSREQIQYIKRLWFERDVLIVEGEKTRFGVGNDLLQNTKSVRRILVPATDAWAKYNEILDAVKKEYKTGDLIMIAAGMTATVLAYDLSKLNFQAVDIGHLDIEYEWLNRGATEREQIPGKFTNENIHRAEVMDCNNEGYIKSIKATII